MRREANSPHCPSREDLVRHAHGELPALEAEAVGLHLSGCERCRAVVGAILAPTETASNAAPSPSVREGFALPTGARLDRFVLVGELGAGGMGRVYAAWDSRLERRVALKVVKHEVMARVENQRAALLNEARAMAQLAHPNVVTVHDVFEADGQLVIAMEYVEGTTLRLWAGQHLEPAERWAMLFDAGRGLAAAHEHGVLHRDFKPDNVLVSSSGRAQVADFGLARNAREEGSATVGGTIGYLAPEAMSGGALDARVDQFAFAVTAWELLAGEKPSRDVTPPTLTAREAAVLRRAMHQQPSERFASMTALLTSLKAAREWPQRRARSLGLAVGVLAVLSLGGWALQRERAMCAEGARLAAPLLAEDRLTAVSAAFERVGSKTVGVELVAKTRARAAQWSAGWTAACRAARSAPVGGVALEEARMRCYARALSRLDVATDEWSRAGSEVLAQAQGVFDEFSSPRACEQVTPESFLVLPSDEAAARDMLTRRLELERLSTRARLLPQAEAMAVRAQVAQLVGASTAPGQESLHAEAATLLASIDGLLELAERDASALEALRAALAVSDYVNAVYAAISVAHARTASGAHEEALRWLEVAEGLAERIESLQLHAEVDGARATVLKNAKRHDEALVANGRAVAALESTQPADSLLLASARNNLAVALWNRHRLEEARTLLEQSVAVKKARLGPDSPALLPALANLASLNLETGRLEEGLAGDLEVLEKLVPVDGKPHPRRGNVLGGVVVALIDLGRLPEARRYADELLALGENQTEARGRAMRVACELSLREGNLARAQRELDQSREAFQEAKLEGDPATRAVLEWLEAELLAASGHAKEANAALSRARGDLRPENANRLLANLDRLEKSLAR